jgi:two-component system, cell cycle sensor histidine kinase and response regulator CckA
VVELSPFHSWSPAAPYALALGLAALLCTVLVVIGWRRRRQLGGVQFALMMAAAAVWALLYSFELTTPAFAGKVLWAKTEYLGIAALPLAWLLFARSYTGATERLSYRLVALVSFIPTLTVVLAATNEFHGLLWSKLSLTTSGSFPNLILVHGPWFWLHMASSYVLLALGSYLLMRAAVRYPRPYRGQAAMLMVATVAPWIGNALSIFRLMPRGGIDVTPFAFAFTGLVLVLSMSQFRLFKVLPALLPTARSQVFGKMKDGVLVLDVYGRVVIINPAAASIFRKQVSDLTGKQAAEIMGDAPRAALAADGDDDSHFELALGEGDYTRYFDVMSSPLGFRGSKGFGRLLVLRDVSEQKGSEEALRKSEERSRAIIAQFAEGFLAVDERGLVTEWNLAMEQITGLTQTEVIGRAWGGVMSQVMVLEHHSDDLAQRTKASMLDAQGTDQSPHFGERLEAAILRPDGERRFVEGVVFPIAAEGRLDIGHIVQDVTERKLGETSLTLTQFSVDHAADFIYRMSSEGRILDVNESCCRRYGYSREEMLGMTIFDLNPTMSPDAWKEQWREIKERGSILFESVHRAKGGEVFPVELSVSYVEREGQEYRFGFGRDISERKRAEAALSESEERLHQMFDHMSSGVAVYEAVDGGADFLITEFNAAAESATRLNRVAVVGRRVSEVFPDIKRMGLFDVLQQVWLTGIAQLWGAHHYEDERLNFWAENYIYRLPSSEVVAIFDDVTERKQAEEALRQSDEQLRQAQKMEAVGQLAGGIAHDFNNLLTAIIGNSSLALADMAPGDPNRELIADVKDVGERAAGLTRQILAFSRRQVLNPIVVCLADVLIGMEPLLRRTLGADIGVEFLLAPGLEKVEVDPHQMEQVLMNLVLNARDAMPKGGGLIVETASATLDSAYGRAHPGVEPGRYVRLAVTDTGCGMDEDTQSHVFEPFFTTKEVGKGTGLGLSTVFGIVKQSGGSVSVHSEPGKGSTFNVYLPVCQTALVSEVSSLPEAETTRGGETILVVEDEASVRRLVVHVLSGSGYEVLEAGSAHEVEEVLHALGREPDLLLTDVVLPGRISGRDVAEMLTGRLPGLTVLFMSGYTKDSVVHDGHLDQGVEFLEKPFTPEALLRKVRAVLDAGTSRSSHLAAIRSG